MNTASKISVFQMTTAAIMTAITCILGPLSIPLPGTLVPITFTNLILFISLYVLDTKTALLSCALYLLIGLAGVPVFSGFGAGLSKLAGPTGGYLIGFLFMILAAGFFVDRFPKSRLLQAAGLILGTAVCYLFGTAWLCLQNHLGFLAGLAVGCLPYLLGDAVKIVLVLIAGPILRDSLKRFKTR